MAKIAYNGMELEELQTAEIENLPKEMIVWADDVTCTYKRVVSSIAIDERGRCFAVARMNGGGLYVWPHFAEIPEPVPRRATWMELAEWCAKGNGLVLDELIERIDTGIVFKVVHQNHPVDGKLKVRKWGDNEWREPTIDYLGIGD